MPARRLLGAIGRRLGGARVAAMVAHANARGEAGDAAGARDLLTRLMAQATEEVGAEDPATLMTRMHWAR
jgi:hypothetical protein